GGEGDGHPEHFLPGDQFDITGDRHPHQRERQREQCVRQLHQIRVAHHPRATRERLPFARVRLTGGAHVRARSPVRAPGPAPPRASSRSPSPCASNEPSPSEAHIASTRRFVASSITTRPGHARVNPSSGHFRVASRPILDPYVNARLEWSSTSMGPIVKRASRSGSRLLSATHHASRGSRTFTSLSTTTSSLASDIRPCPQSAFITFHACPGYCLSIDTNTRL